MANTHSLDLELSSSQYAGIVDGSQTGLDITGDITMEMWIKLEQLPSTAGTRFGFISKFDEGASQISYRLESGTADKVEFFYSADGNTTGWTRIITDNAIFDGGDVAAWVHLAVSVDVSAKTMVVYKDTVADVGGNTTTGTDTSIFNGTADFQIGAISASAIYSDMKVNNARIWSDIRTSGEISSNWKTVLTSGDNLQGSWYNIDSHNDLTSNGNNLTAVASPVFATDVPFVETAGVTTLIGGGIIQG